MIEYDNWVNNPDYRVHLEMPIIRDNNKIKKSEQKRILARNKRKKKQKNAKK